VCVCVCVCVCVFVAIFTSTTFISSRHICQVRVTKRRACHRMRECLLLLLCERGDAAHMHETKQERFTQLKWSDVR
jgi:hypothetical protein